MAETGEPYTVAARNVNAGCGPNDPPAADIASVVRLRATESAWIVEIPLSCYWEYHDRTNRFEYRRLINSVYRQPPSHAELNEALEANGWVLDGAAWAQKITDCGFSLPIRRTPEAAEYDRRYNELQERAWARARWFAAMSRFGERHQALDRKDLEAAATKEADALEICPDEWAALTAGRWPEGAPRPSDPEWKEYLDAEPEICMTLFHRTLENAG